MRRLSRSVLQVNGGLGQPSSVEHQGGPKHSRVESEDIKTKLSKVQDRRHRFNRVFLLIKSSPAAWKYIRNTRKCFPASDEVRLLVAATKTTGPSYICSSWYIPCSCSIKRFFADSCERSWVTSPLDNLWNKLPPVVPFPCPEISVRP